MKSATQILLNGIQHYLCSTTLSGNTDKQKVYECISFVLGNEQAFTLPLFKAFREAREDISKGNILPPEVLEGIRGMYHKNVSQKQILELTKDTSMTEKKKSLVQRKAKKEGVNIAFNPMLRTANELYILAYAEGTTREIWDALMSKGRAGAKQLPVRFGKVGILVDDSFSMSGTDKQKLRPMAIALAMKDVLINTGETFVIKTASGRKISRENPIPRPVGATSLAFALIDLLETGPDAVFIISDGYENSPSGRIDEVMRLADRTGIRTPVYHLNPVVGSESISGLRTLSEMIPTIPVSNPQGLALTLVRAMIEVDIERGIRALASMALPKIKQAACLPA
ncbi:MAG: hypothetical protein GY749_25950 [Desulfobacteraceae bacterium]|nr:hypothetical protein [Desulfobacteraceae bacterium]